MASSYRIRKNRAAIDDGVEQTLIDRWIQPNPHKSTSADEHWLVGSAVPVWAIIGYLPVVNWDAERAAKDYQVPVEAVDAALAYYRRHQVLIDNRVAENALE